MKNIINLIVLFIKNIWNAQNLYAERNYYREQTGLSELHYSGTQDSIINAIIQALHSSCPVGLAAKVYTFEPDDNNDVLLVRVVIGARNKIQDSKYLIGGVYDSTFDKKFKETFENKS